MSKEPQIEEQARITRYLLGELSEAEQQMIEEQYFADYSFFEEILAGEDDLIEGYLRGELSSSQRENFEKQFFSTPARSERVELARGLFGSVSKAESELTPRSSGAKPHSWWRSLLLSLPGQNRARLWSFAAAVAVMMIAGLWLTLQILRLRDGFEQAQRERAAVVSRARELGDEIENQKAQNSVLLEELGKERKHSQQLEKELRELEAQQAPKKIESYPNIVTLALLPQLTRDVSSIQTLNVSPKTRQVQIKIRLEPNDYDNYQATIETDKGGEIWKRSNIKDRQTASGKTILLKLPAAIFVAQDYTLTLKSRSAEGELVDIGRYYFKITRKSD